MRLSLSTTIAAVVFGLLSATGGAQAATSPEAISAVLSECPVEARVGTCANAVIGFANALPLDAERNDDLLKLVGLLAQEAAGQRGNPFICAELEASIRIAGQAAVGAAVKQEIETIADNLCAADVDYTATGSIGGKDDPFTPPESLIEPNDNDDTPPPPPVTPPPADEEDDGDDEIVIE